MKISGGGGEGSGWERESGWGDGRAELLTFTEVVSGAGFKGTGQL